MLTDRLEAILKVAKVDWWVICQRSRCDNESVRCRDEMETEKGSVPLACFNMRRQMFIEAI